MGIIVCLGLLVGSAVVIGGPTGPPEGLDVNVISPDPLPVTGEVDATVTGDVNVANTVDVNVVNDATNPVPVTVQPDGLTVNVSTVYRFVGLTTESTNGDGGGYIGMNAKCQDRWPASRMCTYEELFLTGLGTPLDSSAWINASLIYFLREFDPEDGFDWRYTRVTYPGQIDVTLSTSPDTFVGAPCYGWTNSLVSRYGWIVSAEGDLDYSFCSNTMPVACCAPVNQIP